MLVRDVMNPEPIACQATDAVSDAVKILKKSDISGMPVLEGERLVGVVSESDLLKLLSAEEEGGLWLPSPLEILEIPIRDLIRWERLQAGAEEVGMIRVSEVMTKHPRVIAPDRLAVEAVRIVEEWEVSALIVVEDEKPVGMVHIHEILKAGVA